MEIYTNKYQFVLNENVTQNAFHIVTLRHWTGNGKSVDVLMELPKDFETEQNITLISKKVIKGIPMKSKQIIKDRLKNTKYKDFKIQRISDRIVIDDIIR